MHPMWHGPLVEVWLMLVLARMAGLSCGKEVRNLMLHYGKRPDVARTAESAITLSVS